MKKLKYLADHAIAGLTTSQTSPVAAPHEPQPTSPFVLRSFILTNLSHGLPQYAAIEKTRAATSLIDDGQGKFDRKVS
ncbi:MAG: hypothetical protein HOK25_19705 [Rhodospirillaceae bacterium]|nr:hypothetical protein [Rhodospirillaceae bacterium]